MAYDVFAQCTDVRRPIVAVRNAAAFVEGPLRLLASVNLLGTANTAAAGN
jgi:hypothetical protein